METTLLPTTVQVLLVVIMLREERSGSTIDLDSVLQNCTVQMWNLTSVGRICAVHCQMRLVYCNRITLVHAPSPLGC